MDLNTYFEQHRGTGIMCTADGNGKPNGAVYARPHFNADGTISFIMRDRLTHANLQENPQAHYLFIEQAEGTRGIRLCLKKTGESEDQELIAALSRRPPKAQPDGESKYLVSFRIEKALELLGGAEMALA